MNQKPDLLVAPCSYEAAKYAVEKWHYSRSLPAAPVRFGVWENGQFIGAVLFAKGANKLIGGPYDLKDIEVCELVRVALTRHETLVSQLLAICLKKLKNAYPGLRLVVSYADTKEGHHGGIYQANNWIYTGTSSDSIRVVNGAQVHRRTLNSKYGTSSLGWLQEHVDPKAEQVRMPPKYKYLYPLDRAMRRQIEPLAQPYPKRAPVGEIESRVATSD